MESKECERAPRSFNILLACLLFLLPFSASFPPPVLQLLLRCSTRAYYKGTWSGRHTASYKNTNQPLFVRLLQKKRRLPLQMMPSIETNEKKTTLKTHEQ